MFVHYNSINIYYFKSTIIDKSIKSESFEKTAKKIFFKKDDMLYSGCTGSGLSFYIKYASDSTENDPIVVAKGVDENGMDFEQKIHIHDINPSNATIVEMRALEGHYHVFKQNGFSSLPKINGNLGLHDKHDYISRFSDVIRDMKKMGRNDLLLMYSKALNEYIRIAKINNRFTV